jgi:hypothetical protein
MRFVGFISDSQNIHSVEIDGNYSIYSFALDNFTFGPVGEAPAAAAAVPVPGAAILGMIGIGMVGAYSRKRRQAHVTEA